jgi:hypothetical protein
VKVRWSKNLFEENKCPDQIVLGANDPNWCCSSSCCVQLNLSGVIPGAVSSCKIFVHKLESINPVNKEDKAPNNLKCT